MKKAPRQRSLSHIVIVDLERHGFDARAGRYREVAF